MSQLFPWDGQTIGASVSASSLSNEYSQLTSFKTDGLISLWSEGLSRVMSLHFKMLSRFVVAFYPRSKHLLTLWLQSLSAVILEPKKIKSATVPTFSPPIEVMGPDAMILVFKCWVLSQLFHSPLSPSSRGSLVSLRFLPLGWYHLYIWSCWYFSW